MSLRAELATMQSKMSAEINEKAIDLETLKIKERAIREFLGSSDSDSIMMILEEIIEYQVSSRAQRRT